MHASVIVILRILALLPLIIFHLAGVVLGRLSLSLDKIYARRINSHLMASGVAPDAADAQKLVRKVASEAGKSILELIIIWFRPLSGVTKVVRDVQGWEHVAAAYQAGHGFIILTPHFGCFELIGLYCGMHYPFTILYRPPKISWLGPVVESGRRRAQIKLAPTNIRGVKSLLHALQKGEAVGLLPDQVPGAGEGVWADFFGNPAYTMTLAWKLAYRTKAPVIFASAIRLPWGRGYHLRFEPFAFSPDLTPEASALELNRKLETLILRSPTQYLWSYNRYKTPAGLKPLQKTNQAL